MNMDELENGLRVRHITSGRTGTIRQWVDVVEVHFDDGDTDEVFPEYGDVRPEDLEPLGGAS